MTVSVVNVDTSADSFGGWLTKTNIIADALTNKVVTTDSNTAAGNAAITGSWTANAVYANNIYGGTTSLTANITFNTNASFIGVRTKLGLGANVQIDTGNSTFRVLTVNSAASNTLVATKLQLGNDLSDVVISSPSNNSVIAYNSANGVWYNSTALIVYYANGVQAYP